jgi:hypothetical protein
MSCSRPVARVFLIGMDESGEASRKEWMEMEDGEAKGNGVIYVGSPCVISPNRTRSMVGSKPNDLSVNANT